MPQSLSNILVHLVFSTKNRVRSLTPEVRDELFAYFTGVLRNSGCRVVQTGGVEDHVHILFVLSRTITVAQVTEKLKSGTSKWIKEKWPIDFSWQAGYGAFSVGAREVDQIVGYIRNQEKHHQKVSFQDEFRELLREAGVEFDERFLWE